MHAQTHLALPVVGPPLRAHAPLQERSARALCYVDITVAIGAADGLA
jgi:hypothetical protein